MNSTLADIDSPIYQQLVQEHGDVVAEARATADRTQRQAGELLDWGGQRQNQEWFGGRSPGGETSQQQRPAHQEQRFVHQEQRPAQSEGRPSNGQGPAGQSPAGESAAGRTPAGRSPGEQFFGSRPPQPADAEA